MSLFIPPNAPVTNAANDPVEGGTWNFFVSGSASPAAVYRDASRTNSLGSVVTADAAGRFGPIYLDDGILYRAVLKDPGGTSIMDVDPYPGPRYVDDMTIGLFDKASTVTILEATDLVRTAGHRVNGVGAADYIYDGTVDQDYVGANKRTSFISANGRGFRLAESEVTPQMFGAVPGLSSLTEMVEALQSSHDYAVANQLLWHVPPAAPDHFTHGEAASEAAMLALQPVYATRVRRTDLGLVLRYILPVRGVVADEEALLKLSAGAGWYYRRADNNKVYRYTLVSTSPNVYEWVEVPPAEGDWEKWRPSYEIQKFIRLGSGLRARIDGIIENTRTNGSGATEFYQCCIMMGVYHPAMTSAAWGTRTVAARYPMIGSAEHGNTLTVSAADAATLAAALRPGDLIGVLSDSHYKDAHNFEYNRFLLWTKATAIDTATGVITLEDTISELFGTGFVVLAQNNGVKDLNSEPMYVLSDVQIDGIGGFRARNAWVQRNATRNVHIKLGYARGQYGISSNGMGKSSIFIDDIVAVKKMWDIAASSHHCQFGFGQMTVLDKPDPGDAAGAFNENSRDCVVTGGNIRLPTWSGDQVVRFGTARHCGLQVNEISAPKTISSAFLVTDGNEDCWIDVKGRAHFGTGLARVFAILSTAARFEIRGGRYIGSVSTGYAVQMEGYGHGIAGGASFDYGALRIHSTAATNCWSEPGAYFGDGLWLVSGASTDAHDFRGLRSKSWLSLRGAGSRSAAGTSVGSSVAGNDVRVWTVPGNSLVIGDRIVIEADGSVAADVGTKTIRITDDTGDLATVTFGDTSAATVAEREWELRVEIDVISTMQYRVTVARRVGSVETRSSTIRAGLDFTLARTFDLQAWSTDAAQMITVRRWSFRPQRRGFNV